MGIVIIIVGYINNSTDKFIVSGHKSIKLK